VVLSRTRVLEPNPTIKLERAVGCDGRVCGLQCKRSAKDVHWHVVIETDSNRERTRWVLGVRVAVTIRG
jgi:hypothetical protein